jgi:hypothetical protein
VSSCAQAKKPTQKSNKENALIFMILEFLLISKINLEHWLNYEKFISYFLIFQF